MSQVQISQKKDAPLQNNSLICTAKLTEKRKRILGLLRQAQKPLSAYEIADEYNRNSSSVIPPMSVYRMLDYLESQHFVYKLRSANKYIAYSLRAFEHPDKVPQFLVCSQCGSVKEILIEKTTLEKILRQPEMAGYSMIETSVELQCVCNSCEKNKG